MSDEKKQKQKEYLRNCYQAKKFNFLSYLSDYALFLIRFFVQNFLSSSLVKNF